MTELSQEEFADQWAIKKGVRFKGYEDLISYQLKILEDWAQPKEIHKITSEMMSDYRDHVLECMGEELEDKTILLKAFKEANQINYDKGFLDGSKSDVKF